ncbi:uncharacterized protein LOC112685919 [Sipha flava]|uniref:Uncharacterized protein LOC112685919 n=1 Tax=Sipha flava TaxID=143950 RepID=A0A8B8FSK8_9HEMI|nr:uncharacterized protein LOC112685919 [Sipha flava]
MTLPVAHRTIQYSIRVLESMANIPGPKSQEVISAYEINKFKAIPLYSKSSIVKIQIAQFFISLSNYMKERLMTIQASNVSSCEIYNEFQINFKNLIEDFEVFSPENWSDNMDIQYGDTNICRLSQLFQIDQVLAVRGFREYKENKILNSDIKPLLTIINSVRVRLPSEQNVCFPYRSRIFSFDSVKTSLP